MQQKGGGRVKMAIVAGELQSTSTLKLRNTHIYNAQSRPLFYAHQSKEPYWYSACTGSYDDQTKLELSDQRETGVSLSLDEEFSLQPAAVSPNHLHHIDFSSLLIYSGL